MRFSILRPTPALIIAVLALVVSLGGATYAVSLAPRNSVRTASIQGGAVTNAKVSKGTIKQSRLAPQAVGTTQLADGAVTGAKVTDHSLTGADLDSASLPVVHSIVVRQTNGTPQGVAANATLQTTASCQPGETAVAGGAYSSTASLTLYQSWPTSNSTWVAVYVNDTGASIGSAQVIAWASCMS